MTKTLKDLQKQIIETAKNIEIEWLRHDNSSDIFHEVVWEQTRQLDLSSLGRIENQLKFMELDSVRNIQLQTTFSDCHFKVFDNNKFFIEVLNWRGGQVNIHDHDFSGVQFQLKGSSLNIKYDFDVTAQFGGIRTGKLAVRKAEIWEEGSRSVVRHGNIDPHTVLHLSRPTTSLLIRTHPTARYGAQTNYFPTLATHYHVHDLVQRKKTTALNLLATSCRKTFASEFYRVTRDQSFAQNFAMVIKLARVLFSHEHSEVLKNFAEQSMKNRSIVENVACYHSLDFYKHAIYYCRELSDVEKAILFAGLHISNIEDESRLTADLVHLNIIEEWPRIFSKLLSSLPGSKQTDAIAKLRLFHIGKVI